MSALFTYPKQAEFGRTLPKNKIYERSGANTRLKDLFVEQVEHIVWSHKLAPETINLPASPSVPEIQIFSIQLKSDELNEEVLRCIDCAIPFPILFEVTKGQAAQAKIQLVATYKRLSEAGSNQPTIFSYFASEWLPASTTRTPPPPPPPPPPP